MVLHPWQMLHSFYLELQVPVCVPYLNQDLTNQASTSTITLINTLLLNSDVSWGLHSLRQESTFWYISISEFWKIKENCKKWTISTAPRAAPGALSSSFSYGVWGQLSLSICLRWCQAFLPKCQCSLNIWSSPGAISWHQNFAPL